MTAVLFPANVQVSGRGGRKDEDDIRLFIEPILINSQRNKYKRGGNSRISLELHFLQFAAVVRLSLAQAVLFLD